MKKLVALMALTGLLGLSAHALAAEVACTPTEPDGKSFKDYTGPGFSIEEFLRKNFDAFYGCQSTKLTMPVKALIPCYLEMNFKGNDYFAELKSFGFGSHLDTVPERREFSANIVFIPAMTGFVDKDWAAKSASISDRAEVEPKDATASDLAYIRACDTFSTDLWSNLDYKYSLRVVDGGLKRENDDSYAKRNLDLSKKVLPIDVRYAKYTSPTKIAPKTVSSIPLTDWTTAQFKPKSGPLANDGSELIEIIKESDLRTTTPANTGNACKYTSVYQQFKIPYTRDFMAGNYKGEIEILAATL